MSTTSRGFVPPLQEFLKDAPKNWGRWGEDDEIGTLNTLSPQKVMESLTAIRSGKVFTLQAVMCDPAGDPTTPQRQPAQHFMVIDNGTYRAGKVEPLPGGARYADDFMVTFLHGTTHYDALGHVWCGNQIWNGFDAETTVDGLDHASILPIAQKGIVGRGVLLDIARLRDKATLEPGEAIGLADILSCAERQNVQLRPSDVLLIRTGWLPWLKQLPPHKRIGLSRPGLSYSPELVLWFHEMEIASVVTDTTATEISVEPTSGVALPLHVALMSFQGVTLAEMAWLEGLAEDCLVDGQYDFLFVAAPLKVMSATGSPVNPIVIK